MADPTGILRVTVNGAEYKLHLGWSVLAELQDRHGQDFLMQVSPPDGAPENWLPPLRIVVDVIEGALQRYHPEEASRWLADDILANCPGVLGRLMATAFPEQKEGNGKKPKAAA
jgi:hypothetical protein